MLAGALLAVGLLAWACSGGGGQPRGAAAGAVATASPAGQQQAQQRTPVVSPSPTASASPRSKPSSAPRHGAPPGAHRPKGACSPSDLVLTMNASGTSFRSGDRPSFALDVVNVGSRGCAFDAGPKSLNLLIKSGQDRIWDSADCAGGHASKTVQLARGVPYSVSFSWDRLRSSPGCRANRTAALPGTYAATAYGGGAASRTDVFTLGSR